jgi:hypothetical protein
MLKEFMPSTFPITGSGNKETAWQHQRHQKEKFRIN